MIPDIGLIISAYAISRMAAMLGQPSAQTNILAKVLCVIAIVVTIACAADLIQHGASFK